MKFLADENFPKASIKLIESAGLDVISIQDSLPGIYDDEVMRLAIEQNRTILTFDTDFGSLIFQENTIPPKGVIL